MCRQVDIWPRIADEKENWASSTSRSAIARAGESTRGRGQSSHERWGREGKRWKSGWQNKSHPRINAALEKALHFREAEINSSRGY